MRKLSKKSAKLPSISAADQQTVSVYNIYTYICIITYKIIRDRYGNISRNVFAVEKVKRKGLNETVNRNGYTRR